MTAAKGSIPRFLSVVAAASLLAAWPAGAHAQAGRLEVVTAGERAIERFLAEPLAADFCTIHRIGEDWKDTEPGETDLRDAYPERHGG